MRTFLDRYSVPMVVFCFLLPLAWALPLAGQEDCSTRKEKAEAALRTTPPAYRKAIDQYFVAREYCTDREDLDILSRIKEILDDWEVNENRLREAVVRERTRALNLGQSYEDQLLQLQLAQASSEEQVQLANRNAKARELALRSMELLRDPDKEREALFLAWSAWKLLGSAGIEVSPRVRQTFGTALLANLQHPEIGMRQSLAEAAPLASFQWLANDRLIALDRQGKVLLVGASEDPQELTRMSAPQLVLDEAHRFFLLYSDRDSLRLYDAYGDPVDLPGQHEGVVHAAFSPDETHLITSGRDGNAFVWDIGNEAGVRLEGHAGNVYEGYLTSRPEKAVTRSADQTVRIWDGQTGEKQHLIEEHKIYVYSLSLSPDNRRILTASADQTVRIWDLNGQQIRPPFQLDEPVMEARFSPDGKYIWGSTNQGRYFLLELATGRKMEIVGHDRPVEGLVFHPARPVMVSWAEDEAPLVWDLNRFEPIESGIFHREVSYATFSSDGNKLLTTSAINRESRLWKWEAEEISLEVSIFHRATATPPARFHPKSDRVAIADGNELLVVPIPELVVEKLRSDSFFSREEIRRWRADYELDF